VFGAEESADTRQHCWFDSFVTGVALSTDAVVAWAKCFKTKEARPACLFTFLSMQHNNW
jgi:hypothetical protein